jgi:hypothetical protein
MASACRIRWVSLPLTRPTKVFNRKGGTFIGPGAVLVVQIPERPDNGEINRWRRDLLNTFDPDDFNADGPLRIIVDDDLISIPEAGPSAWLDVGILLKFSGEGRYVRGDSQYVSKIAEWLEANVPNCRVWYGHDAGDGSIQPFGMA